MDLHVDDDGFVRAPPGLVYRRLTDLASWPGFWPGVTTTRAPGDPERWRIDAQAEARGARGGALRLTAQPHAWRHDQGFHLDLTGDLVGRAEFWLEPGWGGTVVHHVATLRAAGRGARRRGVAYRALVRRGLCGLKDDLQSEVRERLGLAR